jgi:hypothetical protein
LLFGGGDEDKDSSVVGTNREEDAGERNVYDTRIAM